MASRINNSFSIRGMAKTGDSAKQDKVRLSLNTLVRPGTPKRIEARSGFAHQHQNPDTNVRRLVPDINNKRTWAMADANGGGTARSYYYPNAGAWSPSAFASFTVDDELFGINYPKQAPCTYCHVSLDQSTLVSVPAVSLLVGSDPVPGGAIYKAGGAATPVTDQKIFGTCVASAVDRIFVGSPRFDIEYVLNDGDLTSGVLSNATMAGTGYSRSITYTTAAGYWSSTPAYVYVDGWITYTVYVRAQMATTDVPITVSVLSGGLLVAKQETFVVRGEGDKRIVVTFKARAGSIYEYRVSAGNSSAAANAADTHFLYTALVYKGAFVIDDTGADPFWAYQYFRSRIYWCETGDYKQWRAENFVDLSEYPGLILSMPVLRNNLAAFKERGVWIYKFTDNPDLPLAFVDFIPDYGVLDNKACRVAFGKVWFVDNNNIYSWDLESEPQPLVSGEMREYLFDPANRASTVILEIDTDFREIIVQIRANRQHVLNLETGEWTEYKVASGVTFADLLFHKTSSDTYGTLYGAYSKSVSKIVKDTATDQPDGSVSAVAFTAEQWLGTIDTPNPQATLTLERVELEHLIESATTLSLDISKDNGLTWTSTSVPIGATNLAQNEDVERTTIGGIRATAPRFALRITGPGGPDKFRLTGASYDALPRGKARQDKPAA